MTTTTSAPTTANTTTNTRRRAIAQRTRGQTHGPITRLVSPSDLGEALKPFVFLDYFARGFRHYCQAHGLRHPRLPLIQEFSLDEGSLQAGTFSALHEYRRCVRRLIEEIEHRFITPGAPNLSTEQVAALLLCSSALFGGLARKVYWQAFLTALASPLQRSGDSFSFRFNQRPPYRWIADPVTEALLRRLWQWRLLPLPEGAKISPTHIRQLLGL